MISTFVRAVAVVLLLAAGQTPAAARVFDPETFTLANGMQVVVVTNRRAPIVTHMVWYRAGAGDEVQGRSGIAHFLEHLMFKGTEEVGPGEFSRIVARNGGRDNAFTSHDYTGYFQNVARDRLEAVMRLESDRMANLSLREDEVLSERDVILEERRQVIDSRPPARLREQLFAALFLNHPYGRPIIGWLHEMRTLTRQDAIDWYRRWYAPNNAVLIVAGDISAAELRPLAERTYGAIPARPVPARARPQEPPPQTARRVELRDERVQQPNFSRLWLAPSYRSPGGEHAYALEVLADILGGGQTARLPRALVEERNLAVNAGAFYDPDALDQTTFGISASPRPGVDIAALEAAVDEELARVVADGVSPGEVARAIQRMQDSAVFGRDSLQTGARVFGQVLTTGGTIEDVEQWPERIAAVTAEQVNAAARAVLRPEASVTGLLLPRVRR
ncbi:MAG: insulinase family protein [Alphaproteobacteria bacterium]|nr:insulinase family protein [Alphaproteobacteria bacterium]